MTQEFENTKKMLENTTDYLEVSSLKVGEVEKIAAENKMIVLHEYSEIMEAGQENYTKLFEDTEKVHLTYDINGYIQGINVNFLCRYGA